jgi:threonine dehydratase
MHDHPPDIEYPTLERIHATATAIAPFINATPVQRWRERELEARLGSDTEVFLKLELFQRSGSFKVRGVIANMLALSREALKASPRSAREIMRLRWRTARTRWAPLQRS